jgi:hypothetical protein
MIPFGLLTNQTRVSLRPPRRILLANAQILARVAPVRVKPRQAAREAKKSTPAPERSFQNRSGWKTSPSPLIQLPMNASRFGDAARLSNPPAVNGNGKTQHLPPTQESSTPTPAPIKPEVSAMPEEKSKQSSPVDEKPAATNPRFERRAEPEVEKHVPPTPLAQKPRIEAAKDITPKMPQQPSLQALLDRNPDLPTQTVVLGICDDGLPLALDLYDPAPGALLAMGDMREEQIGLLHTVVASACLRNSPRTIQFMVISHQPETWKEWVAAQGFQRHCISIERAHESTLRDPILLLADWTEQRRLGQRSGPPILLVVDTLTFLPRLDYDIRLNFEWLIKEGPPAQIWTVAAISTELASSLGSRLLRAFQSRILGCVKDPQVYTHLAGLDQEQASEYTRPGNFAVQAGESWIHFQLPGG